MEFEDRKDTKIIVSNVRSHFYLDASSPICTKVHFCVVDFSHKCDDAIIYRHYVYYICLYANDAIIKTYNKGYGIMIASPPQFKKARRNGNY